MNRIKRLGAALVALALALMVAVPALAEGTGSITITLPTNPAPTAATTYRIYRVFDADGNGEAISYRLVAGKTVAPAGFSVDGAGNVSYADSATGGELSAADIAAIATYVSGDEPVRTVTAAVGDSSVTVDGLPNGYYYISTTTGSVVTIDSTNPDATVEDKNVIPGVVKSAGSAYSADALQAIAAVGSSQPFTAQITKTHGATNLVFTDTMDKLSYNNDLAITVSAGTAPTPAQAAVELTATGFTVRFDNGYLAGLADGTVITLAYSATVTSDALSADPATNTATLTSGGGNTVTSEVVRVYNAKLDVSKRNDAGKALAGAGFVIKSEDGRYYRLAENGASISWVDSIDDATEHRSGADGSVPAFTGLGAGSYSLVEKTVPSGYNRAADTGFTVTASDFTTANLEQTATVTNRPGAELPSTGGRGATVLYVLGAALAMGAVIALAVRRTRGARR